MVSKVDEMMQLLTNVLKGKGLTQTPNPLTTNEGDFVHPVPISIETKLAVAADIVHTRLMAENLHMATNAQVSSKNSLPQIPRGGEYHQDLPGENHFYTFQISSASKNGEKDLTESWKEELGEVKDQLRALWEPELGGVL